MGCCMHGRMLHLVYAPGDKAPLLVISLATCHGVCLACSRLSVCKNGCIATIQDSTDQIISTCLQQTAECSCSIAESQMSIVALRPLCIHYSESYLEDVILACVLQNIVKGELQQRRATAPEAAVEGTKFGHQMDITQACS